MALDSEVGRRRLAGAKVALLEGEEQPRAHVERDVLEAVDVGDEGERLRLHRRVQEVHHARALEQVWQRLAVLLQVLRVQLLRTAT